MRSVFSIYTFVILIYALTGCDGSEDGTLPSAELRKSTVVTNLENELTQSDNGWIVRYEPDANAGAFQLLLNFRDDNTVRIRSDISSRDGQFLDDVISYRVSSSLGLELIFDSYGVFHFLFEQERANFGAEFQFFYEGKENDNLVFTSKSDLVNRTRMVLVPATTSSASLIAGALSSNMASFNDRKPDIDVGIGVPGIQQLLYLQSLDLSLFWDIDLTKRLIDITFIGKGSTVEDVLSNPTSRRLSIRTGYYFSDNALVFLDPVAIEYEGLNINFNAITLNSLTMQGLEFCAGSGENTPIYTGEIAGIGSVQLQQTLFSPSGLGLQPDSLAPYSVNALFVFGDTIGSLLVDGIISERFPDASGFIFNYGVTIDSIVPDYAIGFIINDGDSTKIVMRELQETMTDGNKIALTFKDEIYVSRNKSSSDSINIVDVTNEIFEGGHVYAYDEPVVAGLAVYRLYNPCNDYEFFLVGR